MIEFHMDLTLVFLQKSRQVEVIQGLFFLLVSILSVPVQILAGNSQTILSLGKLNTLNHQKNCSSQKSEISCSSTLKGLAQDDGDSRAFIIESRAPICKKNIESANLNPKLSSYQIPTEFQKLLEQNRFEYLGPFSNSTIKACLSSHPQDGQNLTAKFYYYTARLNAGATKIAQDRQKIAKLLGKSAPPCPDAGTLEPAFQHCEESKKCPNEKNLDQLAKEVDASEALYNETQEKLKSLPSSCVQSADCKKAKEALSGILFGLQEQNPWFLNDGFQKSKGKIPTRSRLTQYLTQTDNDLAQVQAEVTKTAACIHGGKKCDLDEMRKTLSLMPDLPETYSKESSQNYITQHMAAQSCLEEGALDRNNTGKIMNETYINLGLTVATVGVGALFNSAKFAGSAAASRWGRIATEATNLTADSVNAFLAYKEVAQSCVHPDIAIQFKNSEKANICKTQAGSLSTTSRDHGACLVNAGLGVVATLAIIPGGLRAAKLYQESSLSKTIPQFGRRANDRGLVPHEKISSHPHRIINGIDGTITRKVESPALSSLPKDIRVIEAKNIEGKKQIYYQAKEKLPDGTWVRSSREIQFDPMTGAIDANYPAGRELFEKIAKEKAGKAHLAFIDVASLGTVNNTFAGGVESGDRYLKGVAEKILKHGDGKVTLARLGGDEFGLIIDESDPQKVKALLDKIRTELRKDLDSEAKQVFREEKIKRALDYRQNPSHENRQKIDELSRIQQPDISIGSTQIGSSDDIASALNRAEAQAKEMKISTTLEFGRSAEKYGSKEIPQSRPNPMYMAEIKDPTSSPSWTTQRTADTTPALDQLRELKIERQSTVKRFHDTNLAHYKDELGRDSYRLEIYATDPKTGKRVPATYEIPLRGQTGMLDGTHPESKILIHDHFFSQPHNTLVMPKLTNLRYLNYFESGTEAGDRMLSAIAQEIKKETRDTDLTFKLNGSDFIWSMGHVPQQQVEKIFQRINKGLKESPIVKEVMEKERKALLLKEDEAIRRGDSEAINEVRKKMNALKEFKADLQYEVLRSNEVPKNSTYENLIQTFEKKFKTSETKTSGK
ncbi:MAG: hypothetical protein BroJett040_14310 [Oligoflexia bacterium]|nr:MAG: hypothetical protein BroJett040_14310 [Oligoflexia bacterium]